MNDIDMVGDSEGEEIADPALDAPMTRSDSLFSLFKIQVPVNNDTAAAAAAAAEVNSASENGGSQSRLEKQSHIRSSIELSKSHLNEAGRRKRLHRNLLSHQQQQHQQQQRHLQLGMLHFRKKSFNRTRTAMLQRFQDRSAPLTVGDRQSSGKTNSVVSIAALKAALSDSPRSYLDNGDLFPGDHQKKTVFVSEYI